MIFDLPRLLGPDAKRSPDMEAVWTWMSAEDKDVPNWLTLPPAEARQLHNGLTRRWNSELPSVESAEPLVVPGEPDVPCQLIVPHEAEPGCILFLHGGGWAFGDLQTHQRFMRLLAIACRRRLLAVDYRLAPEHPYPAPFEDSRAAWQWLVATGAEDERFAGPLAVAGDSAGANLALALSLDAVDRNARRPDAALLFYGAYEGGAETPSYDRFATGFGLTGAAMRRFWDYYVPDRTKRSDPLVSPTKASDAQLRSLPPLFLNAAGLDPLLCDTLDLVSRLEKLQVPHRFELHDGVHHGFMQMSLRLPEAQRAIDFAASFLRDVG